jgi:hypothetical protein
MGTGASALLGESDHPAVTRRDPEDIAPMVVYLASEEAGWINGQVFFVSGGTIALMAQPRPGRTIYKPARWTIDELRVFVPARLFEPGFVSPGLPRPEAQQVAPQAGGQPAAGPPSSG